VNVLGIDTATAATAVALQQADGATIERRDDPPPGSHPGHATRLLAMTRELLADAGLAWRDLDLIAVGLGPGTFTGLRVGIATARGLAQSLPARLVGVGSLTALAMPALADRDTALAVIDARRGEVFTAAYRAAPAGAPVELCPPRALAPGAVGEEFAGAYEDGHGAPCAVGDGARRYRDVLSAAGLAVPSDASPLHAVTAGAICALGALSQATDATGRVVPDYRRRPDAEIAFEQAGADAARRG
jgi:tRNA threonylcarbamoyladenosine biosynthesis protein TsaB